MSVYKRLCLLEHHQGMHKVDVTTSCVQILNYLEEVINNNSNVGQVIDRSNMVHSGDVIDRDCDVSPLFPKL